MTAAVYRWLSGKLDHMTGEDALILVGVIATLSVAAGYALFEAWVYLRKRLGTWHDRVTLKHGPIPFDRRGK